MHRDACNFLAPEFDLSAVEAGSHGEANGADSFMDRRSTSDGARGPVEDGEKPIPGRVDFATAEPLELSAHGRIMTVKERAPLAVTDADNSLGGTDDVREEHGRKHSVLRWGRRLTRRELEHLIGEAFAVGN